MSGNKMQPTPISVETFLKEVTPEKKRLDALSLDQLFREATSFVPQMWGENMVGYGRYRYKYASGREGEFLASGFSPRARAFSIYIMPGYTDYSSILDRLGKHKMGKSCLYINKLADVDLDVLGELIKVGLRDLDAKWPVQAN